MGDGPAAEERGQHNLEQRTREQGVIDLVGQKPTS
jgi:hypothetical protein